MTEDAIIEEVELTSTDASDSLSILSNSDNDNTDIDTSLSSNDKYNNGDVANKTFFKSDTTINQVDDSSISKSDVSVIRSKHHHKNLSKISKNDRIKLNTSQGLLRQSMLETGDAPKRKKKRAAICLTNCRYEVVRRTAARFGMREVSESDNWDLYWTDLSISIERAKDMRRFQRVNHFPGMLEICRKDLLARNLNRMLRIFPKDYGFFPKTWCLPADLGEALAYSRLRKNRTYILKPDAGSQGRGIYLTRSLKDLKPNDRMICQVYLSRPFLIDGFKFDLRVYTLITSCDPLRIYVYNEGLARFATSRYREPTGNNTTNVFMHLTNYAVNKHSRTYNMDDEGGSKRKISSLNRYLVAMGYDVQELWESIDEVIVKTIIAAWPILKHSYHACFPSHDLAYACFELLGFDVLLDHKLKPYILEVNHSPSFHCDTVIDSEVKSNLLFDTFTMLDIARYDKRKVLEEDRRRVRDRLLQGVSKDLGYNESLLSTTNTDPWIMQDRWESMHLGGFRQAYPGTNQSKYAPFFRQTQSSLYCQTAASRARDTAARIQRQEMETKAKLEALKRIPSNINKQEFEKEKLRPESPEFTINNGNQQNIITTVSQKIKARKQVGPVRSVLAPVCNSFLPGTILESDERERIAGLAQRDLLIRNYGLLQQIYFAMKMNGSLRMDDQKKYAQYTNMNTISSNNKTQDNQISSTSKKNSMNASQTNKHLTNGATKDLEVVVNEAHIYERPLYSDTINAVNNTDTRSTKTQLARSLVNTVRMIGNSARNEYQTIKVTKNLQRCRIDD